MRNRIIITWLAALAVATTAFAQGRGWDDHQSVMNGVSLATNIAVATVPIKIAGPDASAVRVLVNSGSSAVTLLLSASTTASATVTNQLSGSLGTLTLGAGATNVFKRGGALELWSGYIYGQSSAATNNVVYLGLKP